MFKIFYFRNNRQKMFNKPDIFQTLDPEDFAQEIRRANLMGWEIVRVILPKA